MLVSEIAKMALWKHVRRAAFPCKKQLGDTDLWPMAPNAVIATFAKSVPSLISIQSVNPLQD
jgi:hypothetical protein